jgi:hypothetical protein
VTRPLRPPPFSDPASAARLLILLLLTSLLASGAASGFDPCNGRDDDRDGTLDPGCPSACADPRGAGDELLLSPPDADATVGRDRSLAWDGRRFVAVWVEEDGFDTSVQLARTGPSGRQLHDPISLSEPAPLDADAVVAAGAGGYGIAWSREDFGLPEILFAHVDEDGTLDAGPVVVGTPGEDGQRPAIAWDGNAYAVAWAWYNSRVYLQRIAPSGDPVSEARCLNCDDDSGAGDVSLAVGPSGLGVAYDDARGTVKLARTDADGAPLGPPTTVSGGTAQRPSVAWADGAWAVAWYDRRDEEDGIYLNRIDGTGALLGPEVEVDGDEAYSWDPSVVWSGAELQVGWAGADGTFHGLFLRRLAPDGQPLAPAIRLPGGDGSYPRCSLVWNGSRPALLRDADELAASSPARLRLVECCPDDDGDGVARCDGDCDDSDAGISPGGTETCDGRDDDCDGALDEGCDGACSAAPWHDLGGLGAQESPGVGLAARGGNPEACVARAEPVGGGGTHLQLDRGGPPWQSAPLEQDDAASTGPSAARTGDRCAVVWRDDRGTAPALRFGARSAVSGSAIRLDVDLGLAEGPSSPVLARTGASLALGYVAAEPRWSLLSTDGARLLDGIPLAEPPDGGNGPAAVAVAPRLDGPGAVVAHLDPEASGAAIRLERRDADGGREEPAVLVAPAAAGRRDVAVTATGAGYLVAWSEPPQAGAPTEIHLRAHDADLAPAGPASRLTAAGGGADAPALAFTGTEVVVVFRDRRDGAARPFRTRVDAEGARLGPDTPLGGDRDVGPPRAAWSGTAVWTAWTHGAVREVRPGRIACSEAPEPGLVRRLEFADDETLVWEPVEAALYDVVSGALDTLASGGGYASAVDTCEASDLDATELTVPDRPLPRFYLVRAVVGGNPGSYDADGPLPTPDRDPGIAASPDACP